MGPTATSTKTPLYCLLGRLLLLSVFISPSLQQYTPFLPGFPSPWANSNPSDASSTTPEDASWSEAHRKAAAFVSQLTLPEKINITTGTGWEADRCIGMTGSVPRLGMSRGLCLMDGPLGIRYTDHNSAFPAGINAAATFSRRLMRLRGEAMGAEFKGKGIDVQLGPVAGALGRVPQGGRNWEGFSPDPYLTGIAISQTITGIQSRGVIACAKHYILNEQEHFRGSIDVSLSDKTMHELYLWPFADAVRAGVGSVMCSYNKVRGAWACENEWTTNYLLKNELGFQGFVMSDWGAQKTTVGSALAGMDMAMPGDAGTAPYRAHWGGALTEAVLRGEVPEWRLDDMVVRIMAAYFKVNPSVNIPTDQPEINFSAWSKAAVGPLHPAANESYAVVNEFVDVQNATGIPHGKLIREIGAKSVVLLKNNKTLPLRKPKSLAVIGEDAHDNPAGPNACAERACVRGTLAMGYGSGTAEFPYLISPYTALKARAEADGTQLVNISSNWDLTAAKAAAASADVALVFALAHAGENFITIDGNAGDRNNLTLWNGGDELIKAVASVNPNTVVILHTPGPVIIEYAKRHPNITAILWAGLPGQESGNSLADVLYGDVNPQGRSPFTWGKSLQDYGAQLDFTVPDPRNPRQSFDEGVFIDYRHFQQEGIEASYEFGHGLSYTTFEYSDLKVTVNKDAAGRGYGPMSGTTGPAPTYGAVDKSVEANLPPEGFPRISPYVYPWLNSSGLAVSAGTGASMYENLPQARNGSAQPLLPAGGGNGGNPGLWEVLYTVSVVIKNSGEVSGTEIPQLYLQLGGDQNPFAVLRGFEEVGPLAPGESKTVSFHLTRRDVSNWNTDVQNWEITSEEKFIFVGQSVVQIRANATLPLLGM